MNNTIYNAIVNNMIYSGYPEKKRIRPNHRERTKVTTWIRICRCHQMEHLGQATPDWNLDSERLCNYYMFTDLTFIRNSQRTYSFFV